VPRTLYCLCRRAGKIYLLLGIVVLGLTGCGGTSDTSSFSNFSDPPVLTLDPPADPPAVVTFADPPSDPLDPPVTSGQSDPLAPVPEPSSAALLASGITAFVLFRRSIRKTSTGVGGPAGQ